jgi:hypothetical protein
MMACPTGRVQYPIEIGTLKDGGAEEHRSTGAQEHRSTGGVGDRLWGMHFPTIPLIRIAL